MSGEGPDKGKKGGRGPYVMQTRRIEAAYGAGANEDDIDRPVGVSGALPMSGPVRPSRQGPQARGPTFPDRRTLRRRASEQQSAWTSFFFFLCGRISFRSLWQTLVTITIQELVNSAQAITMANAQHA